MFEYMRMNNNSGVSPTIKTIPSTPSTTYTAGEALVLTSGKAAMAAGTTAPEYICASDYVAPATGNKDIQAYLVNKDMEFKVPFDADGTALTVGTKVTIGAAGLTITATTASGVAEITKKYGTGASGTYAAVRF